MYQLKPKLDKLEFLSESKVVSYTYNNVACKHMKSFNFSLSRLAYWIFPRDMDREFSSEK